MDIIERAIKQKMHISSSKKMNGQTWEEFEKVSEGKDIILFGAGACAGFYWERYKGNVRLSGIIDNDLQKHGRKIGEIVPEAFQSSVENMKICSVEDLKKWNKNKIVVLVTSTCFYEDIVWQLENIGIMHNYVLLIMEANYRKEHDIKYDIDPTVKYLNYAKQCCKEIIRKNKIIFKSFGTYSDHGKYITEHLLLKRNDLDIVWIVEDLNEVVPEGIRLVYAKNWKKYIYEMETAYIWIINTIIPQYLIKRYQQIYIHTKHWASITLKKFYLDASTITDVSADVELWKYNSKCIDYIITGSNFDTISCRRGFDFHKEVIEVGSPRTDAMFREKDMKLKVSKYFSLDEQNKILLYAPTYRYKKDNALKHEAEVRNIELNYEMIEESLKLRFGGDWHIMCRLHPAVKREIGKVQKPDFVIDVSDYPDSEELAAACDIMISDYSSIMFEPAFVKKPVFLFATDRKDYIDKEYDLLIDYDTLPFPIAETNEELASCILNFDQEKYEKELDAFMEKYGVHEDGHASERATEFISNLIDGRK